MDIVSGTYDFVGGMVRLVRDADLSLSRIRELSRQVIPGASAQDFAEANPDVAAIVQAIAEAAAARGHGGQWVRDFLLVLSIVMAVYFGMKQVDLASEQVDLGRRQVEQTEQQQPDDSSGVPASTGALTDEDIARLVVAVQQTMSVRETQDTPPPVSRRSVGGQSSAQGPQPKRRKRPGKTFGRDKKRPRRG
jgi:hypothetical protein